eukprot:scaffold12.g8023.t1
MGCTMSNMSNTQSVKSDLSEPDHLAGNDRYVATRALSRGAFGFARDKRTGENVALKFLPRGAQVTKYIEREILNQMRLRHPHIISVREGIVNRDIKLENTLLDGSPRPLLKLADFGFSKDSNAQSAPTTRLGTPAYLAPEVVANPPGAAYDGRRADIWCCGVCLYFLVVGAFPFWRKEDAALRPQQRISAMLYRILAAEYAFPPGLHLSPEIKDLIARMLARDPAQRIPISDMAAHPWFAGSMLPQALAFNDSTVAESLANQPSEAKLAEVGLLVGEARRLPPGSGGEDDDDDSQPPSGIMDDGAADSSLLELMRGPAAPWSDCGLAATVPTLLDTCTSDLSLIPSSKVPRDSNYNSCRNLLLLAADKGAWNAFFP